MSVAQEAALVDYREDDEEQSNMLGSSSQHQQAGHIMADDGDDDGIKTGQQQQQQGNYVAVETAGFRDFYLKPELIRALGDAGFEHPSEVQHEAIPHAITGVDILCQAKSGMGKTAVFVLSVLHQLEVENEDDAHVQCLVIAHARELAFQIKNEFDRFRKHLRKIRCDVFYGGVPITKNIEVLENPKTVPHILIGTPGRVLALIKKQHLKTDHVRYFILDECDKCLEKLDMRKDVQDIFIHTPRQKQVMMLTATLNPEIKDICRKFMKNPVEVIVDDEAKLTLHGLLQYYVKLNETEKNRTLSDLLDKLEFNQVIIFVKNVQRAVALDKLLNECSFPSIPIHAGLSQEDRIRNYHKFKNYEKRIMVATDLFSRGIDIERVNIVINYDMPESTDSYLHRVGRAGRFGTKGLAITFIASQQDSEILNQVQSRFEAKVDQIPDNIDSSQYKIEALITELASVRARKELIHKHRCELALRVLRWDVHGNVDDLEYCWNCYFYGYSFAEQDVPAIVKSLKTLLFRETTNLRSSKRLVDSNLLQNIKRLPGGFLNWKLVTGFTADYEDVIKGIRYYVDDRVRLCEDKKLIWETTKDLEFFFENVLLDTSDKSAITSAAAAHLKDHLLLPCGGRLFEAVKSLFLAEEAKILTEVKTHYRLIELNLSDYLTGHKTYEGNREIAAAAAAYRRDLAQWKEDMKSWELFQFHFSEVSNLQSTLLATISENIENIRSQLKTLERIKRRTLDTGNVIERMAQLDERMWTTDQPV